MLRALTQLLPEDHWLIEKRSCKRRDSNERPKYQNVRVSFLSMALFLIRFLQLSEQHIAAPAGGVLSCVTLFYGKEETKFHEKQSERRLSLAFSERDVVERVLERAPQG